MAKRQMRLYTKEIPNGINKVINFPLSIVMKTGAVFFYRILKMENDHLKVANMRKQIKNIKISDIEEIIIEAEDIKHAQKSIN
jgi:hypothetical protein